MPDGLRARRVVVKKFHRQIHGVKLAKIRQAKFDKIRLAYTADNVVQHHHASNGWERLALQRMSLFEVIRDNAHQAMDRFRVGLGRLTLTSVCRVPGSGCWMSPNLVNGQSYHLQTSNNLGPYQLLTTSR